jgi:hypothetical protein
MFLLPANKVESSAFRIGSRLFTILIFILIYDELESGSSRSSNGGIKE